MRFKLIISLFLLLFIVSKNSYGGNDSKIDIRSEVKEINNLLVHDRYRECIEKAEELRIRSAKLNEIGLEMFCYSILSNAYFYLYNYPKSLKYGLLAETKFTNPNDTLQLNALFLSEYPVAEIYYKLGKLPNAYKRYWKIIFYAERQNNVSQKVSSFNAIGILLFKQNKLVKSRDFFIKALIQSRKEPINYFTNFRLQEIYDNIGLTFYRQDFFDSAKIYYDSALYVIEKLKPLNSAEDHEPKIAKGVVFGNLARLFAKTGKYDLAKKYARLNLEINVKEKGIKEESIRSLMVLARCYVETDSTSFAESYLQRAEQLIYKYNYVDLKAPLFLTKSMVAKGKKDYLNSIKFLESYNEIQDSLRQFNLDYNFYQNLKDNEVTESKNQLYMAKQRELIQKNTKEKSFIIAILSAFLLVVAFLFIVLFFRNYLKEKKLNEKINASNLILENTNNNLNNLIVEKNEIISIVAHDLRSPLSSNIGLLKILKGKLEENNDKEIEVIFNYLDLTNSYLIEVTDDLVESSNLERDDYKLNLRIDDIVSVFTETLEMLIPDAKEKKIEIVKLCPSNPIMVSINKEKIKRSFVNIISNAMKYTPEGGSIYCSISQFGKKVTVEIKDTGIGISEKNLKNVFKKFSKASRHGVRGEKSNGLGLYIVSKIVELHSGKLEIESKEFEGTKISITLDVV